MRPSYIGANLVETAAEITLSGEDSVYDRTGLFDRDFARPLRFLSGGSNFVELRLLSPSYDGIFIGNHNLVDSATVTVKAGSSPNPSTVIDTPAWSRKNIISKPALQTNEYVRIEITDSQPAGTVTEIGELSIGARVVLPRGIRFGRAPHIRQQMVKERTNRGKRYALELYRYVRREYSFRFLESELALFEQWWEAVNGAIDPFPWLEDDAGTEALYMFIESEGFTPQELSEQAAEAVLEYSVVLEEAGLGAEIKV